MESYALVKPREISMAWIFVVLSICFFGWVVFRSSPPPLLGDYGEWTYHGVLLRDLLQGHPDAAYWLKDYPVPNSLTTVGLGLLMLCVPWAVASKLWLLLELVLGTFATGLLQRASGRTNGWVPLVVVSSILLGSAFWYGFENFLLGLYFAMIFSAMLVKGVQSRWKYAALLLLIFFSHMIACGFALLVLLLYTLQQRRPRLLWQAVPVLILFLWYLAGRFAHGDADSHAGMIASVPYLSPAFFAFKANSYLKSWGFINPASTPTDSILLRLVGAKIFVGLFVVDLAVAAIVLARIVSEGSRAIRGRTELRFIWLSIFLFFAAGLVMPGKLAGISDPGGRMIQVAVWCAVCLLGIQQRWIAATLAGCSLTLLAVNCYLISGVAAKPAMSGVSGGPLPARLRQFAHVESENPMAYDAILAGRRDMNIYPTAMFLHR